MCAVKPKFRVPGQTFAEGIGSLIDFIEKQPLVKAGDLVKRSSRVCRSGAVARRSPGGGAAPRPSFPLNEQREKIARMQSDLLWLVREGYVTEFIDGSSMRRRQWWRRGKREVEREESDPENFPEPAGAPPGTEPGADAVPVSDSAPASVAAESTLAGSSR